MIIIGNIQLTHSQSFIEARNKIRLVARLFTDESLLPTRLAAITSQICRSLTRKKASAFIRVQMDDDNNQSSPTTTTRRTTCAAIRTAR